MRITILVTAWFWLTTSAAQTPAGFPAGGFPAGPPGGPGGILTPLPADAPKAPTDPKNLEGTWVRRERMGGQTIPADMDGNQLPFNAEGEKTFARRQQAEKSGIPFANAAAHCLPPGPVWQMDLNFPFQIYQAKNETDFVFQLSHGVWRVRMDQTHRSGPREYMGDAVGHWDGDTFVIETTNFKQAQWLDHSGNPVSENAHITYRIRKIEDGQALEVIITIDDPQNYTKPWSVKRTETWRPDKQIFEEYNCEKQLADADAAEVYGMEEEPK